MIVAIILCVIILIAILLYNSIVGKKNQIDNAFSAIDVMLKKRFELIPNLIEVVKQYTNYEQTTLTKIVELRTKAAANNLTDENRNQIDQELGAQVKNLMVNIENYPDLKANSSYLNLQRTWTESEEQIAAARRSFNAAITNYNDAIMMFPGSIIAGIFSFQKSTLLSNTEEERKSINAKDLFQ
jgi:LemA protein